MATTTVPLPEYLASNCRPDREYIDGVIEERNLGEYDHARLQTVLAGWFLRRENEWNIRVIVEQRIRVSATRYRVPDVTVLSREQPIEPVFTRPPLLLIEILSPEDTVRKLGERIDDYLDFGVAHIWVLDPVRKRAWVATRGRFDEIAPEAVLTIPGTPVRLPLAEAFPEESEA
jgi:Uma2 family endonuclease